MSDKNKIKVSIQLFNLLMGGDWDNDITQDAAEQLITKIADAGFNGIEPCGFMINDRIDIGVLKDKMNKLGLSANGYHFHLGEKQTLPSDYETAAERCIRLGSRYLIFAYSTPRSFGMEPDESGKFTPNQIDRWAEEADTVMDKLRNACKGNDIRVLYHNHADEFLKGTDGRPFIEMIHPDGYEYDVYWVSKGLDGKISSALDYIRKHKDNAVILHIKDGLDGSLHTGEMCGWGKGTFHIQAIIDCAKELGIEWVVNENDAPKNFGNTGLEDAFQTGEYIKKYLKL